MGQMMKVKYIEKSARANGNRAQLQHGTRIFLTLLPIGCAVGHAGTRQRPYKDLEEATDNRLGSSSHSMFIEEKRLEGNIWKVLQVSMVPYFISHTFRSIAAKPTFSADH